MLLPQQNFINGQPTVSANLVYVNNNTPRSTSRAASRTQSHASNTPRDITSLEAPALFLQENISHNDNIIVEIQNVDESALVIINNSTNIENVINNDENTILNPVVLNSALSNEIPIDQDNTQTMNQNTTSHVNIDNVLLNQIDDDSFLM